MVECEVLYSPSANETAWEPERSTTPLEHLTISGLGTIYTDLDHLYIIMHVKDAGIFIQNCVQKSTASYTSALNLKRTNGVFKQREINLKSFVKFP